ncbi:MAG TPA: ribonuclease P protein component [Verrucomicrobiae bacterium]
MGVGDEKRLRFGRKSRLRTGSDFGRVRQRGYRSVSGCLIANWLRQPAGAPSRLGVVTSAKVGGAVQRNRARRLLRECYRLHQHEFHGPLDLVLVARPAIAGKSRAQVEREFLTTVRKAGLLQ